MQSALDGFTAALESLASGFPYLIFYLLLVTAIFLIGLVVYVKLTPHREIELIQHGNMAAAISFSGLIIGLSLPLAACLIYKVGLMDVLVWGSVSVLLQLFLFRLTDMVLSGLSDTLHAYKYITGESIDACGTHVTPTEDL